MTDHANEMFLKWKESLNAGDFSKAHYFERSYWAIRGQDTMLSELKSDRLDLQRKLGEEKDLSEIYEKRAADLTEKLETVNAALQKSSEQNSVLKQNLEKERSKKK